MKKIMLFVLSNIIQKLGDYIVLDISIMQGEFKQMEKSMIEEQKKREEELENIYKNYYQNHEEDLVL